MILLKNVDADQNTLCNSWGDFETLVKNCKKKRATKQSPQWVCNILLLLIK